MSWKDLKRYMYAVIEIDWLVLEWSLCIRIHWLGPSAWPMALTPFDLFIGEQGERIIVARLEVD